MKFRRFVKRSIEYRNKLFIVFSCITVISGLTAWLVQRNFGESSVYRAELSYPLTPRAVPVINIYTAGMPVEVYSCEGTEIRIKTVSELPLIVELGEYGEEFSFSQDDGFAVSMFTLDMFRYKLTVELPRYVDYREINITTAGGDIYYNGDGIYCSNVTTVTKNGTIDRVNEY